jgi:hypothetical protein
MTNLPSEWLAAKEAEAKAVETRRQLEDQMASLFGFDPNSEGTTTFEHDGHVVKIVGRMNRKVDSAMPCKTLPEKMALRLSCKLSSSGRPTLS